MIKRNEMLILLGLAAIAVVLFLVFRKTPAQAALDRLKDKAKDVGIAPPIAPDKPTAPTVDPSLFRVQPDAATPVHQDAAIIYISQVIGNQRASVADIVASGINPLIAEAQLEATQAALRQAELGTPAVAVSIANSLPAITFAAADAALRNYYAEHGLNYETGKPL